MCVYDIGCDDVLFCVFFFQTKSRIRIGQDSPGLGEGYKEHRFLQLPEATFLLLKAKLNKDWEQNLLENIMKPVLLLHSTNGGYRALPIIMSKMV